MAMVVVLSVFNGIEGLVESLYNTLDSEIVIQAAEGKRFDSSTFDFKKLEKSGLVAAYSRVIEDEVLIQYGQEQTVATLKGVEPSYLNVVRIDSAVQEGSPVLFENGTSYALLGAGLRYQMQMPGLDNILRPLEIYSLPKGSSIRADKEAAFQNFAINVGGIFSVNADFDTKYVFVPLAFAKECFNYDKELTGIELKLKPGTEQAEAKEKLQSLLGKSFKITSREEKNALIFQTSRTEKWVTFFILIFIVLIAAFNILASLTMLIIEKKGDLYTLRSMGFERREMVKVFFLQSLLINGYGTLSGLLLGLGFCWAQINYGLIRFEGSIVEYYPVDIQLVDMFAIVAVIGVIATVSFFGVRYLVGRHIQN